MSVPHCHRLGCRVYFLCVSLALAGLCSAADNELDRFPIVHGEPLCVPIRLNEQKGRFILYSLFNVTVVDEAYRDHLGPVVPTPALTANRLLGMKLPVHRGPHISIGTNIPGIETPNEVVACMSMTPWQERFGVPVDGLIAFDRLAALVVRVHVDEGYVAFLKTPKESVAKKASIVKEWFLPHVSIHVSDDGFRDAIISLGDCYSVLLDQDDFRRLLRRNKIVLRDSADGRETPNIKRTRSGILDVIEVGPYKIQNVKVYEGAVTAIGLGFVRRFELDFDFPNRIVHFCPSQSYQEPERWDCSGIAIERKNNKTLVCTVIPSSVPGQSGVRVGDELTHVNDSRASELSLAKIRDLLSTSGSDVKLVFERNGVRQDIVIKLVRPDDPFPTDKNLPKILPIPD